MQRTLLHVGPVGLDRLEDRPVEVRVPARVLGRPVAPAQHVRDDLDLTGAPGARAVCKLSEFRDSLHSRER